MTKTDNYDYKLIIPGEPKYQQRHRSTIRIRGGCRGVEVKLLDGSKVKLYRKDDFFIMNYDPSAKEKKDFARMVIPLDILLTGPLRVDLHLYSAYLKGHYGTGRNSDTVLASAPKWKITKPDKDNAEKFVFDALNGIIWEDDAKICAGDTTKQYSREPRTEICITLISNIHEEKETYMLLQEAINQ